MVDSISGDQVPPISPNADQHPLHSHTSGGRPGDSLYHESSSFYSWYQWNRKISDTEEGFHHLQIIMQIARKGGLTKDEEATALARLKELREDLEDVKKTIDQIPFELGLILEELVENNSTSKVIHHATKIEMKLIHHGAADEKVALINQKLETLVDKVIASYTPMQAEEVSRQLRDILQLQSVDEMKQALETTIFPLLDKR